MRRRHFITRNHTTAAPSRYVFVDTEALNEHGAPGAGVQRLWFGCAIFVEIREGRQSRREQRKYFETAAGFWEWVEGQCVIGKPLSIFAHNFGYDAGILWAETELRRRGWRCTNYINGTPGPLIVSWAKGPVSPAPRMIIKMFDSMNYFSSSLADLGEATGLAKLDPAALTEGKEAAVAYCWRDTEIVMAAVLAFRDFVIDKRLGNLRPTIAGQAMSAFRHRFMRHKILVHDNAIALKLERASFHGGRTEALIRGRVPESHGTLFKLDIHSHYPSVMQKERFSARLVASWATYQPLSFQAAIDAGRGMVALCHIETDKPIYGVVLCSHCGSTAASCKCAAFKGEKLIFPVGRFWTTLSTPELMHAWHAGHVLKVKSWAEYEREPLFRDYVDYFYDERMKYKVAGNAAFAHMAKTLLNSLYGKFGERALWWTETRKYQTDSVGEVWTDSGPKTPVIKLRNRLGVTQMLMTDEESNNSCPIISSEITGYGRLMLWRLIDQAGQGEGRVYYCDTDSLIVNQVAYDNLAGYIHPTNLGFLGLEGTAEYGEFMAPKHYTFGAGADSETKIKGVSKRALLWSDVATRQTHAMQPQFQSWDVNQQQGIDGQIIVRDIVKAISGENTKMLIRGEGEFNSPIELWE
jgi:hypothetical protein